MVKGKRVTFQSHLKQPHGTSRVPRATLERLKHQDFPKYIKAILADQDKENARLRLENKHKMAAKFFENKRKQQQALDEKMDEDDNESVYSEA